MWRIKRRRTKPIENKAKTGVIYPKFNATAKQNRYVNRNTYLDVKCNRDKGAGCTIVGCQCQGPGSSGYPSPNITSFSDITNVSSTGVADYKTRVNTIAPAPALFHDFTTWYGPTTNQGTTYQGVYGNSPPPSGNANFSLPLPAVYNHISITYNNPHPGSGSDAVYIFIGGVGSGALPTENPSAYQAVNKITNGTTGASKTYEQIYQAGDYLKIQEKASVITTALVIELTFVPNIYCCKTAPYRNPILGYRKHLIDCSGNTDLSGCGYTKDVSGNVYKDNYAKTCATHPEACYNQVIRTKQNKNGCVDESYNYSTNQYLNRRCLKFQQQEFNFISQVPVDASGSCTKFMSCANCQYNSSGMCDCSSNGFCTGINKLPCEVKNTKCFAIYKRSNSKFNKQGAVSGGSRINRLKYQTRVVAAQRRKANGRNNVINGRGPAALYTTSRPPQMNAPGCWLNKDRTKTGLAQRCIVTDPCCCPTTSSGVGACCDEALPEGVIKICCGFSPESSNNPAITLDDTTIGFLKDAQGPYPHPNTWNNGLGSDFDYPLSIGTLCPPTVQYTPGASYDIGGFAWQPVDKHLWFFLSGYYFSGPPSGATGDKFNTIEFSTSPSFPAVSSITLSGTAAGYSSNALNEVHWESGSPSFVATKLDTIFGTTAGDAGKSVYIKITYI